jgi:hypothetical protein
VQIQNPDKNCNARVCDVADPDRHGKIIGAGSQQSEVRFDDGAVCIVPNDHLRAVDHELAKPTDPLDDNPEANAIRRGQEAWCRLRAGLTWSDWIAVGAAHVIGRTTAMRDGHINKPKGRSYNAAFSAWQKKFGFKDLDKGDRARLFDVMDHLKQIDDWRQKLPESERLRLNHPNSVWRRWKAATVVPDPNKPLRVSHQQKLNDELVKLQEDNDRMKRDIERGGGDLWSAEDRPQDIAKVIVGKLTKNKAEKVARAILKMISSEAAS